MSDSSDDETKKITRVKKPMSEAKLRAVEKMKEGRRKQLALKKKEKEEKKETLKKIKKATKTKISEELSSLNNLSNEELNELRHKALFSENDNPSYNGFGAEGDYAEEEKVKPITKIKKAHKPKKEVVRLGSESSDDEEEIVVNTQRRKQKKPKKRVIINNYYDEEGSSSEEEEVNNYYSQKQMGRRPNKKNHKQETSSEEEEEESGGANFVYGSVPRGPHHQPPNPFGGISFC